MDNYSIPLLSVSTEYTHSPAIQVLIMDKSSVNNMKSASAPKCRVPFSFDMPSAAAGCKLAASKAYSVVHP